MNHLADWSPTIAPCEHCGASVDLDREPEALHTNGGDVLCAECRKDEA